MMKSGWLACTGLMSCFLTRRPVDLCVHTHTTNGALLAVTPMEGVTGHSKCKIIWQHSANTETMFANYCVQLYFCNRSAL